MYMRGMAFCVHVCVCGCVCVVRMCVCVFNRRVDLVIFFSVDVSNSFLGQ